MTESPLAQMTMRGKWADGIVPRHFHWIVKDSLAICERPGGYGSQHRRVRRIEEIIWIKQSQFNWVISHIDAPSNLHNYQELDVSHLHRPIVMGDHLGANLALTYGELKTILDAGHKVLAHHEELGDKLCGYIAGYLIYAGLIDAPPRAVTVIEQITSRQLGPVGREIVATAASIEPAAAPEAD